MVCVFARKTSEPLASLVKQIDQKIGENKNLKSFVVVLTKDSGKTSEELRKIAQKHGIQNVPLTLTGDPAEVPDYELSKEADVTVLMWSQSEVKANRAFKGDLTDENIQAIMGDLSKILGQ